MKKILLTALLGLLVGFPNSGNAQCTFGNIGVKVNSSAPGPVANTCVINFDLYFDIDHNPGGKYFWLHIWPTNLYTNYNYGTQNPPTTLNGGLTNSLTTFGFFHQGGVLNPLTSYNPDVNAPGFQSGYTITEVAGNPDRYTVHGLIITLPQACNVAQSLTADAWQSQSADAQNVHCWSVNQPFFVNDPTAHGLLYCQSPRQYTFTISSIGTTDMTVNYKVLIDNGDGVYNAGSDVLDITTISGLSGTIVLSAANNHLFTTSKLSYLPYAAQQPEADRSLWVVVTSPTLPNAVYALLSNSCFPLPVQFRYFTAERNKAVAQLQWTTASETDNKGFYIERKYGLADWEIVGYVVSLSMNGNSQSDLNYSFIDNNTSVQVTQYRIKQVDINNRAIYSNIRVVEGYKQNSTLLIYPNPSVNGQVNVVFQENNTPSNIELFDMNGRLVKKWVAFRENRLTITNILPGMYILKVVIPATGEQISNRIIVSR